MKRGQAAMEWLETYGWAILVVLAAIGALAYFGVLTPKGFATDPSHTYNASCMSYVCDYTADAPLRIAVTQNNKTCYDGAMGRYVINVTCSRFR